ncbi:hypothetical protein MTR67_003332 [Solanum verrucosum]|uniref:Uncharacterized protein n=1 Tax=Solanum verrucosum TaxID=315347 RepID=A0AAF0PSM7_SOLVR|nr:hypothetical protein MTR67_003332 [Solanum verrucosum]
MGERTVKGITVRRPARGSHPPRSGGPWDPSRAVGRLVEAGQNQPKLMPQTTEPTTDRGLDDGPWEGPSS